MRALWVAVALSVGAPLAAAPSAVDEGRRLLLERKYPEAAASLERAAQEAPGSPEVLLNLGWAYWHGKRFDDALRVGATLVSLDPDNRSFLVFLANTHIERREYGPASEAALKALRTSPGDKDASMVLARASLLDGRPREALGILDGLLAAAPGYAPAAYRRAELLSQVGRKPEALEALERLLEEDPTNASYRRSRAKLFSALGRQEDAKDEWADLSRGHRDTDSLLNLAWAHWREGRVEEAWVIAGTLVRIDEHNPVFLRLLANLEIEKANYTQALRLARKAAALAPGDRDAGLTLAKALFRAHREREAGEVLEKLLVQHPGDPGVESRWGEFLARSGRPESSLPVFDRLIKGFPGNPTHRMSRAAALYELGRFEEALSEWGELAGQDEPNLDAVRRLRDDAFFGGDFDAAEGWQRRLIAEDPTDAAAWEFLAKIYMAMKRHGDALRAADSAVKADPLASNPHYVRGEVLSAMKDWPGAQAAYEGILKRNPNSIRAFDGLSYALQSQGRTPEALASLRRIEELTAPTVSPYLEIQKARFLADAGRYTEAYPPLRKLGARRGTVIPALLYHGISRTDRTDGIPQKDLRRQLKALKALGYQAMTASELDAVFRGREALPPKPLLITFDDGRSDSFENADPVLKEVGYRATMFVHVSKLRKPSFHAGPEDIARWQGTGRWEIQAHGYRAHDPLPLDAAGRKGHFLPNRMWLEAQGRLETMAEYRARVEHDYEQAKRGVEEILPGHQVVAFAYPYGDYGQNDYSNTPESAAINQALVRKNFRLAFVQEQYGINTLSSNPTDLRRFEVPRGMEAEQLASHLVMSDPNVQARLAEAHLWARSGQLGHAFGIYRDLEARGIQEPRVWMEKGAALQQGGDVVRARAHFERAAAAQSQSAGWAGDLGRRLLAQSAHASAPAASVAVERFSDSETNAASKATLNGSAFLGPLRLSVMGAEGAHSDRRDPMAGLRAVRTREGGFGLNWFPTERLELDGSYARRSFTGGASGAADDYGLGAAYRVFPSLLGRVKAGRGGVDTAAGIRAGRFFRSEGAGATWDPALTWTVDADYERSRFNDGNLGQEGRLRALKRLSPRLAAGAAYLRRDTKTPSSEYYSPRGLSQYTGLLSVNKPFGTVNPRTGLVPAAAVLGYEGGYGVQAGTSRTVHALKGSVVLRPFEQVSLTLDARYGQSPTYRSRRAAATLAVTF